MKCWGCEGDHMYKDCPHRGEKVRTVHNLQQANTIEDMERNVPRIYPALDNKQAEFQSHIIEVESKINNQPIFILIDLGASHIYLDPNMVERFQLPKSKKPWLVQLATGAKRKINEMVKACPMDMNGLSTKSYLNIIPLCSYDFLISMDWLDMNYVVLHCYIKAFTCWDEKGNLRKIQGILRVVTIREVSTL
jgi:hypothetical protein